MRQIKKYCWMLFISFSLLAMEQSIEELDDDWCIVPLETELSSTLSSSLATLGLVHLPIELIELIISFAIDSQIQDPQSLANTLKIVTLIHAINHQFRDIRQSSIDSLISKLKTRNWKEKKSIKFFNYMLQINAEEACNLLILSGAKTYIQDCKGCYLNQAILIKALKTNHHALIKNILKNNDINNYSRILVLAVKYKNLEIVGFLLNLGADPNALDCSDNPVLFLALDQDSLPIAQLLINYGADVNALCNKITEGSLLFIFCSTISGKELQNLQIVTFLLDNNADVNSTGLGGWTPLMKACHNGSICMVKLLLDRGAKLDLKNANGKTALSLAANSSIKRLIKGKEDAYCCCF